MNKTMSAAEAKAKLSSLLDRAAGGEEITITRHGKPVARLVPPAPEAAGEREPGAWKGLITYDPAVFFEPPTAQDLRDWEGDLDDFLAMPMPGDPEKARADATSSQGTPPDVSLLLDSHALIWWLNDDPRMSQTARTAIRPRTVAVWVSAVTGYELRLKERLGELHGVPDDLMGTLQRQGFSALPVSVTHAGMAGALPLVHRDPWDRLLVAQARLEGLALVSADPAFAAYGVETVW